jgi:hypothetical protein
MTPAAKQAFRRTKRQSERHRRASEQRIRGEAIDSEE